MSETSEISRSASSASLSATSVASSNSSTQNFDSMSSSFTAAGSESLPPLGRKDGRQEVLKPSFPVKSGAVGLEGDREQRELQEQREREQGEDGWVGKAMVLQEKPKQTTPKRKPNIALMFVPIATCIVPLVTVFLCAGLTLSKHVYVGGLPWPYFSDTGRDRPMYYIFCVGLTISAALIWLLVSLETLRLARLRRRSHVPWVKPLSMVALCSAIVAAPCLSLLAILDTINYPDAHNYCAYAFFLLLLLFCILNTIASFKVKKVFPELRRAFFVKLLICSLLLLFVILYLPVGLSIIPAFERLTVADCLAEDLGTEYCEVTMRLNETETKLWDYSVKKSSHLFRSVNQVLSVLSFLFYFASYALEFADFPSAEISIL